MAERRRTLVGSMVVALLSLLLVLPSAPGWGAGPVATLLTVSAAGGFADTETAVVVSLVDAQGAPLPGAPVVVERTVGSVWQPVAQVVTDPQGAASVLAAVSRVPEDNVFRARYAGDATYAPSESLTVAAALVRRDSVLLLAGRSRVRDGRELVVRVRWRTRHGAAVTGPVVIQERRQGRWRVVARAVTGADGRARVRLRPRRDVRLRARAAALPWVRGARSKVKRVDNVAPFPPARLPAGAPRPRVRVPVQPLAVGRGANVTVTPIPDGVWGSMVGRSWHAGCPVGREGLRLVRSNYVDFEGYRRRGELVVAASAAGQFAGVLNELHARRVPIRSMHRVDRFGWSHRLQGADDYASMAAGNSSAFNCRHVVGRPGVRSPHSYGRSFDLNPWENPYRSSGGWLPTTWWVGRSHPLVAWRDRGHLVVSIMRRHGFAWTYGTSDAHHFDARTHSGRIVGRCADAASCH